MPKNKIVISSDEEEEVQDSASFDLESDEEVERATKIADEEDVEEDEEEDEDEEEVDLDNEVSELDDYESHTEAGDQLQISSDAENSKLDVSDMSEDLELRSEDDDEEEQETKSKKVSRKPIKITIKPPARDNPVKSGSKSAIDQSRNTRKRQVNYYQSEGLAEESSDSEIPVTNKNKKINIGSQSASHMQQLNPELMLTDEETEYNPQANHDVSKMTDRQRAKFTTEADNFIELDDSGKQTKKNKKQKIEETEEEIALRKAENARKRLDYKNKILEEEKRDTLNKLLKRRATKSREIISEDKDNNANDESIKAMYKDRRPTLDHPALIRYVNNITYLEGNSIVAYK